MSNYNYTLQDEGERIEIAIKRVRSKWMISNHPELVRSLMNRHVTFDYRRDKKRNDGRVKIYSTNAEKPPFPYLSRFAYNHYYRGMKTHEIFEAENWKKEELTIDHLDGDPLNNCQENLYEMPNGDNKKKSNKPLKFRDSFSLAIANTGKAVHLQLTYMARNNSAYFIRYRCTSAEQLCNCIDYLLAEKWNIRARRQGQELLLGEGLEDFYVYRPWLFWKDLFLKPLNKYEFARKIAAMPEDDFPLFDGGTLE